MAPTPLPGPPGPPSLAEDHAAIRPMATLRDHFHEKTATRAIALQCLQAFRTQLDRLPASEAQAIIKHVGAGEFILQWLRSHDKDINEVADADLINLLVPMLASEGKENMIWTWGLQDSQDMVLRKLVAFAIVKSKADHEKKSLDESISAFFKIFNMASRKHDTTLVGCMAYLDEQLTRSKEREPSRSKLDSEYQFAQPRFPWTDIDLIMKYRDSLYKVKSRNLDSLQMTRAQIVCYHRPGHEADPLPTLKIIQAFDSNPVHYLRKRRHLSHISYCNHWFNLCAFHLDRIGEKEKAAWVRDVSKKNFGQSSSVRKRQTPFPVNRNLRSVDKPTSTLPADRDTIDGP